MRDGRGFLVREESLRFARQPDSEGDADIFVHVGFVDLPFPVPGMPHLSEQAGVVRSVLAPVWRVRPKEGGRRRDSRKKIVLPATPYAELVALAFDLSGVEASGLPYRLSYVHIAATGAGGIAVLGGAVDPKATRPRPKTADEERDASLVRRYFEARSTGAIDRIDALIAPGYVDHANPEIVGAEGVVRDTERFSKENADASVTIDTLAAEEELVAARTTLRRSRDGQVLVSSGMAFFRVRDGKLAEHWCCYPPET
jgi:ketosteroid isomerase-like protein